MGGGIAISVDDAMSSWGNAGNGRLCWMQQWKLGPMARVPKIEQMLHFQNSLSLQLALTSPPWMKIGPHQSRNHGQKTE